MGFIIESQTNDETYIPKLFKSVLEETINKRYNELKKLEDIETFNITEERFNEKYGQLVDEMVKDFQKQIPDETKINAASRSKLKKIAYL